MPSFTFIPALSVREESSERRESRCVALLSEALRTLLPGGRCVLVTTGNTAPTEALLKRAGFEEIRTLPGSFYYSWMPSRVTVGVKGNRPGVEQGACSTDANETLRAASVTLPERQSLILRSQARSRHGTHWALWWPLMCSLAGLYVLVVCFTWLYIEVCNFCLQFQVVLPLPTLHHS